MQFLGNFLALSDALKSLRAVWLAVAPAHDPMRYDEAALREIEACIVRDLHQKGASARLLKMGLCVGARRQDKPKLTVTEQQRIERRNVRLPSHWQQQMSVQQ